MNEQYEDALSPVWPELAEVIAASPALVLSGAYYIAEVPNAGEVPDALMTFNDGVETTVLIEENLLPQIMIKRHRGPYKAIRFLLGKPFSAPGFLASAALAIARSKVNQLIYSTYSFDYILVNVADMPDAISGLERMGFAVSMED